MEKLRLGAISNFINALQEEKPMGLLFILILRRDFNVKRVGEGMLGNERWYRLKKDCLYACRVLQNVGHIKCIQDLQKRNPVVASIILKLSQFVWKVLQLSQINDNQLLSWIINPKKDKKNYLPELHGCVLPSTGELIISLNLADFYTLGNEPMIMAW